MAHWRLFYHLVWATRDRHPCLVNATAVRTVERSCEASCRDLRVIVHAVGTMPDHVHLACSIPPSLSIAEVAKRLKGSSSHLLNQTVFVEDDEVFAWQAEYGVYSFSERVLPDVVAYVQNQHTRHASAELWPGFEHTQSLGVTEERAALSDSTSLKSEPSCSVPEGLRDV